MRIALAGAIPVPETAPYERLEASRMLRTDKRPRASSSAENGSCNRRDGRKRTRLDPANDR